MDYFGRYESHARITCDLSDSREAEVEVSRGGIGNECKAQVSCLSAQRPARPPMSRKPQGSNINAPGASPNEGDATPLN